MNTIRSSMRGMLAWIVPFAILALLLGWQTDWGRGFGRKPPAEVAAAAQPLSLALLPEYTPSATLDKNKDAVDRSLFNPTRRPAPVAVAEAAKPKMQRGQFTLAGTIVVEGKTTAFLKEVNGGKPRRVGQGETINGMTVAQVGPDRVKLTLGEESEEIVLKVAAGPRATIQPVVPNAPVTATAVQPGSTAPATGSLAGPRDVADVLAERRRAARAAEAAAAGLPPGTPVPTPPGVAVTAPNMPPVPQGDINSGDPRWQGVYQRYQQPRAR
ncbi:MAG: hypothetical protein U1F54_19135 [Burkholderiales bacterium]